MHLYDKAHPTQRTSGDVKTQCHSLPSRRAKKKRKELLQQREQQEAITAARWVTHTIPWLVRTYTDIREIVKAEGTTIVPLSHNSLTVQHSLLLVVIFVASTVNHIKIFVVFIH